MDVAFAGTSLRYQFVFGMQNLIKLTEIVDTKHPDSRLYQIDQTKTV